MANLNETYNCTTLTIQAAQGYVYSEFERVFILFIVPAVTFIGVTTNGAFLFVIYRVKNMRTATNFYLANLSVADGILIISTSSNYLITYVKSPIQSGYPFEAVGCTFSLLVIYVFSYASIAFLTLVAIERYQAVCMPIHYRKRNVGSNPLNTNIKLTVMTWVLLIIAVSPAVSVVEVDEQCVVWPDDKQLKHFPSTIRMCIWAHWTFIFLNMFDICLFTTALLINIVIYIKIVQELNKRKQPKGKSSTARSNVARMLSINALVFFLCLFPIQLSNVAEFWNLASNRNFSEPFYGPTADFIILWLGRVAFLINSTVNPIIYNMSNPEYHKAFHYAFWIKRKSLRRGNTSSTSASMELRTQSLFLKNESLMSSTKKE